MTLQTPGARRNAGAGPALGAGRALSAPRDAVTRPIPGWAFFGVAVASFGGPLALAGLIAPGLVPDAGDSAGLAMLAAVVVFAAPLAIWLRYARAVPGSGGLYAFVEAAAGRRVALAQAAIWSFSYLLYIVYTTVQIVYDLLPSVIGGEHRFQTLLALAIPVAVAGVMVAGRAVTLVVIALVAATQVAMAGILDGVTLAHVGLPISTFGAGAPAGPLAKAGAQTSLLYVCGSLPLFLGGELASPSRTIRRGLIGAYALTALLVVLAVAPLAAAPGLSHTDVPGVRVLEQFAGVGLARTVGVGIALSVAGVIVCEYLALGRLISAVVHWRPRPVNVAIGAVLVLAAPISLIDPGGFYDTLLTPSLVALWLSQLIVFAVYPRFAIRRGGRPVPAYLLALVASGLAIYGLWLTVAQPSS